VSSGRPTLFQFTNLASLPGVVHGVSERAGGVSAGRCASLNTSFTVGDDEANVEENLRRLAAAVGVSREQLFTAHQVHGNRATLVAAGSPPRPRCDILLTQSRDATLMLRFADCVPVLLADPRRGAVAATHAGWRGTAVRAAGAAVQAMQDAFGSRSADLIAGIGPAIGPCCYTVGTEVAEQFADRPVVARASADGAARLDLWQANRLDLEAAGVPAEQIEVAGICTRCQADRFFSHRANGGQPAGRFAALIRLD